MTDDCRDQINDDRVTALDDYGACKEWEHETHWHNAAKTIEHIRHVGNLPQIADMTTCAMLCAVDPDCKAALEPMEMCASLCAEDDKCQGAMTLDGTKRCWHQGLLDAEDPDNAAWHASSLPSSGPVNSVEMTVACRTQVNDARSPIEHIRHVGNLPFDADMETCAILCAVDPECQGAMTLDGTTRCWHQGGENATDDAWDKTWAPGFGFSSLEMTDDCRNEINLDRQSPLPDYAVCMDQQDEVHWHGATSPIQHIRHFTLPADTTSADMVMEKCAALCSIDPQCQGAGVGDVVTEACATLCAADPDCKGELVHLDSHGVTVEMAMETCAILCAADPDCLGCSADTEKCAILCAADPECKGVMTEDGSTKCWHQGKKENATDDWSSTLAPGFGFSSLEMTGECRDQINAERESALANYGKCTKKHHEQPNRGSASPIKDIREVELDDNADTEKCAILCAVDPECKGVVTQDGSKTCWHQGKRLGQTQNDGDWSSTLAPAWSFSSLEMTNDCRDQIDDARTRSLLKYGPCTAREYESHDHAGGTIEQLGSSVITHVDQVTLDHGSDVAACAVACAANPDCQGAVIFEDTFEDNCWLQGKSGALDANAWSSSLTPKVGATSVEMTTACRDNILGAQGVSNLLALGRQADNAATGDNTAAADSIADGDAGWDADSNAEFGAAADSASTDHAAQEKKVYPYRKSAAFVEKKSAAFLAPKSRTQALSRMPSRTRRLPASKRLNKPT
eukprot:g17989.t1